MLFQTPQTLIYNIAKPYWNDMGGNHFYFREVKVTSSCWEGEIHCKTDDPIVGKKVESKLHTQQKCSDYQSGDEG